MGVEPTGEPGVDSSSLPHSSSLARLEQEEQEPEAWESYGKGGIKVSSNNAVPPRLGSSPRGMRSRSPNISESPTVRRPATHITVDSPTLSRRANSNGGEDSPKRGCCCCPGCLETILGGIPILLFLFMCGDTIFVQESKAVCMRIAVDVMRLQVREPGCVDDPMNDNALVHMTCRLDSPGATDPGTGLRTSGYRIYGTSRMLQWRVMQHYYHPTQQQHHDGSNSDYRWCYCFERFWAASYIELDPMLQWHPRLCVNTNVNPGPVCELMYPGRNPFFPDNGTNTVDSLGKFDTFETDLRLGPKGLRVPPGMIEQIEDDHLPPHYFPLYYQFAGQHATTYQQYEPYVLRLGPMRHGRLAEEGWFHIACAKPPHEDDVHFLYKPSDPEVLANMSYEDAKHHTPCDGAGWIGDRLITFSAFGASRLTVLGLQTNGTLASYDFPFQKSMACARYPTRVMYASRYTHSVPKSADQIFHIQTYHLQVRAAESSAPPPPLQT